MANDLAHDARRASTGNLAIVERADKNDRAWLEWAIGQVEADANRSADTHLHRFPLPAEWGISLYLKDESVHPTGSLKHRLAWSPALDGLCNNWISEDTTLVEALAVRRRSARPISRGCSVAVRGRHAGIDRREKIALIEFSGGQCERSRIRRRSTRRRAPCRELRGHFIDQFTYAERATDWRANNNIAESMFAQLSREPSPNTGLGGCRRRHRRTSATIGRYLRLKKYFTQLCVVDPENSAFLMTGGGTAMPRSLPPARRSKASAAREWSRASFRRWWTG